MDIDLLEESLPESTCKELITVGCDCIRKPELSISYMIEELGDILYGCYGFQRLYFAIIHEPVHHDECIVEIL
jgi:hypothetical protein